MAGIGFLIKKLTREDNLNGVFRAYIHAMVATSGPWIMTCLALTLIFLVLSDSSTLESTMQFRVVILYNFCFSLVFSSPFMIVATRYIADCVYNKDLKKTSSMMFGMLLIQMAVLGPISVFFYLYYTRFPAPIAVLAIFNFLLISLMWLCSVYISSLKYFQGVTISYLLGITVGIVLTILLYGPYGAEGMLIGFNTGLAIIVASVLSFVLVEYPMMKKIHWEHFLGYFNKFRDMALGNFIFVMGIWVDKWVMWFSPQALWLPEGVVIYPYYDSATFIAYLTIIPSLAMFMLSQETLFYEKYVNFYQHIARHANYAVIQKDQEAVQSCFIAIARNILILQIGVCFIVMMLIPKIIPMLEMNFTQIGMFRFGLLGAAFQCFVLYMSVIMAYFEDRKGVLMTQILFFSTNLIFSIISMNMGFSYYGSGFFFAALVTFLFAACRVEMFMRNLPYHCFITTNTSVKK